MMPRIGSRKLSSKIVIVDEDQMQELIEKETESEETESVKTLQDVKYAIYRRRIGSVHGFSDAKEYVEFKKSNDVILDYVWHIQNPEKFMNKNIFFDNDKLEESIPKEYIGYIGKDTKKEFASAIDGRDEAIEILKNTKLFGRLANRFEFGIEPLDCDDEEQVEVSILENKAKPIIKRHISKDDEEYKKIIEKNPDLEPRTSKIAVETNKMNEENKEAIEDLDKQIVMAVKNAMRDDETDEEKIQPIKRW